MFSNCIRTIKTNKTHLDSKLLSVFFIFILLLHGASETIEGGVLIKSVALLVTCGWMWQAFTLYSDSIRAESAIGNAIEWFISLMPCGWIQLGIITGWSRVTDILNNQLVNKSFLFSSDHFHQIENYLVLNDWELTVWACAEKCHTFDAELFNFHWIETVPSWKHEMIVARRKCVAASLWYVRSFVKCLLATLDDEYVSFFHRSSNALFFFQVLKRFLYGESPFISSRWYKQFSQDHIMPLK